MQRACCQQVSQEYPNRVCAACALLVFKQLSARGTLSIDSQTELIVACEVAFMHALSILSCRGSKTIPLRSVVVQLCFFESVPLRCIGPQQDLHEVRLARVTPKLMYGSLVLL